MITSVNFRRTGPDSVMVFFQSDLDNPIFYVYRNRRAFDVTARHCMEVSLEPGESPILYITDDPNDHPPYARSEVAGVQWENVERFKKFKVEKYTAPDWHPVEERSAQTRRSLHFRTGELAAGGDTFRVSGLDEQGEPSTPKTITVNPVRNPEVPDATASYDSGTGIVTFASA